MPSQPAAGREGGLPERSLDPAPPLAAPAEGSDKMSHDTKGTRCAALVGAHGSGKTTLFESLLHAAGSTDRRGTLKDRNTVGDGAPEARARGISTELSVAACRFMDEDWALIDCPGSVELLSDSRAALMVADLAVVVCDPFPERAVAVSPLLRFLDDRRIPHLIFINRLDAPEAHVLSLIHISEPTRPY